jgi:ABC-type polysaccharide/polyol phosphate export permease
MATGGVNVPWNLALAAGIGIFLMFSRLALGAEDSMADAHHIVGALVVTVSVIACAEMARSIRFLNAVLGLALAFAAFAFAADALQLWVSLACALALAVLTWPRGSVINRYAGWNRYIV